MKQHLIRTAAACLVGLGTVFTFQANVNAASQYSAKRSHEVKLIWRKAMGKHAFTAPTGARFSKHLGTRYGYNTETADVTWYTDAHEKLYLKNLHMYSIYYHVANSDQSLQGWIWKGYMKPTNVNSGSTTDSGNSTQNDTGGTGSSSDNSNGANTSNKYLNNNAKTILSLFKGTKYDDKVSQWLNAEPDEYHDNPEPLTDTQKSTEVDFGVTTTLDDYVPAIHQLKTNQITFKQYVLNDLKKQNCNFTAYAGYNIGIKAYEGDDSMDSYTGIGDYSIVLYKP
jgi:hypothetical protein